MTSILRLSKDRSSFLFRRQNQDIPVSSSSSSLGHRLPDISLVDTRSFADLFDQFKGQGQAEDCSVAQQHLGPKKPTVDKAKQANIDINRNDSTTSSCYSQPSQRESEYSPIVTRHSSNSSYTQEPPFATSKSPSARARPLSTGRGPARSTLAYPDGSHNTAEGSRSATNSSSMIASSLPPNLDKPLPPGPSEGRKASRSAPDLPRLHMAAELPSETVLSSNHESAPSPIQPASYGRDSVAMSEQGQGAQAISELPSWTTTPIQPAPERRVSHSHPRHRSTSETTVHEAGSVGNGRSRQNSADFSRLTSNQQRASRSTKVRSKQRYKPITAATAEHVIYKIMCNLHTVQDLRSTAMVSKGFLRTFQRNESKLVSHLLFKTSRPAWELQRSMLALKGSNKFVLRDFNRDCSTLTALKAYIVAHCSSSCKPSTLVGLLGQDERRRGEVDNALWRIWTFCTLFGDLDGQHGGSNREIDWLNGSRAPNNKQLGAGFAIGNGQGLAIPELEDMNEMWQCLQALLSGFRGREEEAKQFGVYDNWHFGETTSESEHLAEWMAYLLSLGPQAILSVSLCSFERARMVGLTNWPALRAGESRSSFLLASITKVYQDKVLEEATLKTIRFSTPRGHVHRPTRSFDERQAASVLPHRTATGQPQSLRIDTSGTKRRPVSIDALGNARLEIRPDCDPANSHGRISEAFTATPTADPTLFYTLNMTSTASTKLGATLFPMEYASPTPRVPFPAPEKPAATETGVVDPVDKAMTFLVHELGFVESRARKALAMCDTGSGIDLQKAVDLLAVDSQASREQFSTPVELPTPIEIPSPNRLRKQSDTYCNGQCKRMGTVIHSRSQSAGAVTDISISPVSTTDENEWQDTISPLVASPMSTSRQRATMPRGASRPVKTWKVLGMDTKLKRKNTVLGIDEYQAKVERRKSMRAGIEASHSRVKDSASKNLRGLGLAMVGGTAVKAAEQQPEHVQEQEGRKKGKNSTSCMPRYA